MRKWPQSTLGPAASSGGHGHCHEFVDGAGENVIAVLPGASGTVRAADVDRTLAGLTSGDTILVQQEIPQPATRRALEIARQKGARSVLNTAPFLADTPDMVPPADIVVANETEFAMLSGRTIEELHAAVDEWAKKTGRPIVVTLGPDGALATSPEVKVAAPAYRVTPVDGGGATRPGTRPWRQDRQPGFFGGGAGIKAHGFGGVGRIDVLDAVRAHPFPVDQVLVQFNHSGCP